MRTKYGLVGVFDILGFRRILSEIDIKTVVSLIQRTFKPNRQKAEAQARTFFGPDISQGFVDFDWLIFADTVVFTALLRLPEDESDNRLTNIACSTVYFFMCQTLLLECFEAGIPLRESIALGDFYVSGRDHIFAGKPFVDAHEQAEGHAWSGCALTSSAARSISTMREEDPGLFQRVLVDWSVPLTNGGTSQLTTINWAYPHADKTPLLTDPSLNYCATRFAAFGKKSDDDKTRNKLANTHSFISQCFAERKAYFGR